MFKNLLKVLLLVYVFGIPVYFHHIKALSAHMKQEVSTLGAAWCSVMWPVTATVETSILTYIGYLTVWGQEY